MKHLNEITFHCMFALTLDLAIASVNNINKLDK